MAEVNWDGQFDGELGSQPEEPLQRPEQDPEFRRTFSLGSGITPNSDLRSSNFKSETSGWRLRRNGEAELNNTTSGLTEVVYTDYTEVGNVGTGLDALMTWTYPAFTDTQNGNYFLNSGGASIRGTAWGYTASNANAKSIEVYWASDKILDTGALTTSDTNNWHLEFLIMRTGGTTAKAIAKYSEDGTTVVTRTLLTTAFDTERTVGVYATGVSDDDIVQDGLIIERLKSSNENTFSAA